MALSPSENTTYTLTVTNETGSAASLATTINVAAPPVIRAFSADAGTITLGTSAGDFNGDGKPDLAVALSPKNILILLGNGDGTFQTGATYATATAVNGLISADFTGDGRLDLAFIMSNSNLVSVLPGVGEGTFLPALTATAGTLPSRLAVGDVNGDGHLDLAAVNDGVNMVSVLLGRGDGTFLAAVSYPAGADPLDVALAMSTAMGSPISWS